MTFPVHTKSQTHPLRIGIGGPVGSGKTALVEALCKRMRDHYDIYVITNDIYTKEDQLILTRAQADIRHRRRYFPRTSDREGHRKFGSQSLRDILGQNILGALRDWTGGFTAGWYMTAMIAAIRVAEFVADADLQLPLVAVAAPRVSLQKAKPYAGGIPAEGKELRTSLRGRNVPVRQSRARCCAVRVVTRAISESKENKIR